MKKTTWKKLGALPWLWKNRKAMIPLLKYEIGSRYYSSGYDLAQIKERMKRVHIQHIDLPELLRKENLPQEAPAYFDYNESTSGLSAYELLVLCFLVRTRKILFEIGTYTGLTTYHLAQNSHPKSTTYTLDLPPERVSGKYQVGEYFTNRQPPPNKNIQQIQADSATFDFSSYENKIDFAFIDGDHSYASVKRDTINILPCLTNKAILVWDDFDLVHHRETCQGILDALEEQPALQKEQMYQVKGTKFLIFCKR